MADQALNSAVDDVLDELLERCKLAFELEEEDEYIFPLEDAGLADTALHTSSAACEEDWSCAVCLEEIPLAETAVIKGCEHKYCVCCILKWCACSQDSQWRCPKCKANFTIVNTYRCLDGSMCDHLCEESICLLLRARWFLGKSPLVDEPDEESFQEYQEHFEDDYYDDEDYAAEDYFYENTRRIVIGNRRYGQNGVISGGRSFARPIAACSPPQRQRSSRGELSTSPSSATPNAKKVARQDKKDKKAAKEAEKRAKRCAKMQAGGSIRSGTSPGGSSSRAGASGSGIGSTFVGSL